jgi:hypothetical protein
LKWWHCVWWPWVWNIILMRCNEMIKLSLVNHGYKIWYFSLHDSNFNKFRWCYYASMILNMKYYSVSINNWYNLSNLGPYNPNIKYWASCFKFVLLELWYCGLIWPWIENMIFDPLRFPTFDKLEDGILPWLTLLLAGFYDRKFNILKW